jgi:hypothetical protein
MTGPPTDQPEFIGIPEWCRRVGCSLDSGYRAARRDQITGLFRIGRLMRVNWDAFVGATYPVVSTTLPGGPEP